MITIPTLAILGVVAGAFTAVPTIMSLVAKNQEANKKMSKIGIIAFSILALSLTLFNTSIGAKLTTISFSPCSSWFNKPFNFKFWDIQLSDVVINSLMFGPLGVMTAQKARAENKKTFKRALLAGFILSTIIEVSQAILPFGRFPALSDIICNTLSAGLGCGCLNLCHKVKNFFVSKFKKQKTNIVSNELSTQKTLENQAVETITQTKLNETESVKQLKNEINDVPKINKVKSKQKHKAPKTTFEDLENSY